MSDVLASEIGHERDILAHSREKALGHFPFCRAIANRLCGVIMIFGTCLRLVAQYGYPEQSFKDR